MTTFPSITGSNLIRALRKFGFEVMRKMAAIISFNTKTGDARLFRYTGGRRLGEVFLLRYYAIVKSLKTSCRKNFKRTCRFTRPRKRPASEQIRAGLVSLPFAWIRNQKWQYQIFNLSCFLFFNSAQIHGSIQTGMQ